MMEEESWKHGIVTPRLPAWEWPRGSPPGAFTRSADRDRHVAAGGSASHRHVPWLGADADLRRCGDLARPGADAAQSPLLAVRDSLRTRRGQPARPADGRPKPPADLASRRVTR